MTEENVAKVFEGLSYDEISQIVKYGQELKKNMKEERDAQKKANKEAAYAHGVEIAQNAEEGDTLEVTLKGERRFGEFLKLTEKRVSINIDGEKKSIMFDKIHRNLTQDGSDEVDEAV